MCEETKLRKFWLVTSETSVRSHFGDSSKYWGATMFRHVYGSLEAAKSGAFQWLSMPSHTARGVRLPKPPPLVLIVECNVVGEMRPPAPVYTPVDVEHA